LNAQSPASLRPGQIDQTVNGHFEFHRAHDLAVRSYPAPNLEDRQLPRGAEVQSAKFTANTVASLARETGSGFENRRDVLLRETSPEVLASKGDKTRLSPPR
jgi:hypothetical protein